MTDCLTETQDKRQRLLLKDGLKLAMTKYGIKFKVADNMEMLLKCVVTCMPNITLSQDVQVSEDEDDGGKGGDGSGGLSGEGEEVGTFSNIAAKADSVDISEGREVESAGVDGGRAGSSSMSKACRASAKHQEKTFEKFIPYGMSSYPVQKWYNFIPSNCHFIPNQHFIP